MGLGASEWVSEPAGRALEPAEGLGANWEGLGGEGKKKKTGPLPKKGA